MGAKALSIDVPQVFELGDPKLASLKRDLERTTSGMEKFVREARRVLAPVPEVKGTAPLTADGSAPFDVVTRVAPQTAADIVNLQLPPPDEANIGREVRVQRSSVLGLVVMRPVGVNKEGANVTINGATSMMLSNALGFTSFTFDGLHYYTDNPGNGPLYNGVLT
jgi:hypothetical protein